jgi:hypothetical protein
VNEFVLNGLVKRRAELAGDIENTHEALRKMVLDLENLDATIVQFDPDFKVETIKPKAFRPPKDWSNRGQMSRAKLTDGSNINAGTLNPYQPKRIITSAQISDWLNEPND